ncbi:peptidase inhibitor family I36 protein [Nonomuraea sp. NPDC003201]
MAVLGTAPNAAQAAPGGGKPNAGQAPRPLDPKRCRPGMFCIFADPDFKGDVLGTFGDVANVGVASRRIGGFNIGFFADDLTTAYGSC